MDPHAAMYRRLLSVFSSEAAERIQRVNNALLGLERAEEGSDRNETLTGIMRELHTLKGAGGSVNLEDVETISHELESVFGPVLQAERDLTPAIFAVAYDTMDAIEELIAAAVDDRPASVDVSALVVAMRAAADAPSTSVPARITDVPAEAPPTDTRSGTTDAAADAEAQNSPDAGTQSLEPDAETQSSEPDAETPEERGAEQDVDVADDEVDRAALLGAFAELQGEPFAFVDRSDVTPPEVEDPVGTDHGGEPVDGSDRERSGTTPSSWAAAADRPPDDADAVRARVLAVFSSESLERVRTVNRRLMKLERHPDVRADSGRDALDEILREIHTLKGSGATVHVEAVEHLAHQLETLFGDVRDGARPLDADLFDVAYRALDAVEAAVGHAARTDATGAGADAGLNVPSLAEGAPEAAHGDASRESASKVPHEGDAPPIDVPRTTPDEVGHADRAPSPGKPVAEDSVRVSISKLDALMSSVSELLVTRAGGEQRLQDVRALAATLADADASWREARARLGGALTRGAGAEADDTIVTPGPAELDGLAALLAEGQERFATARTKLEELLRHLQADAKRLGQVSDDLEDDVRRARMLPVAMVFDAFPRLIRDLARDLGKQAKLEIEGADTEVDRSVIEQIRGPLTHLLRNAIDHGIEAPSEREASGKPAEGTITLSASQSGDSLFVEISDDGAGIDPDVVRSIAVERRVLSQEAADATSDADALRLVFRAGFSTRGVVTDLSGRGVGLDVVRDAIEHLRGSVDVRSVVGEGTRFTLQLPLSISTAQCVMVSVAGATFALPISNVVRILRLSPEQTERADGRLVIRVDGEPTPVVSMAEIFGLAETADPASRTGIVLASGDRRIAFVVDELLATRTLVLKPLPPPLVRLRYVSGAAILGTGEVIGVLSAPDLVRRDEPASTWFRGPSDDGSGGSGAAPSATILVVDDSNVTRALMKGVLETAGYRVQTAADGMEAWEILRSRSFDLVVTDVNMPEMSGFDLTEKVRADRLLNGVPVILVTALDSAEDQARGARIGANAYIVKGALSDDRLLEAVRELV